MDEGQVRRAAFIQKTCTPRVLTATVGSSGQFYGISRPGVMSGRCAHWSLTRPPVRDHTNFEPRQQKAP